MQISISTRHGSLTSEMNEYLEKKTSKLLKIFDRIESIEATVDWVSDRAHIELLVNAEHKHDMIVNEESDSFHGAVDMVVHRMEEKLRRYKEKLQGQRRRQVPPPPMNLDGPEEHGEGS